MMGKVLLFASLALAGCANHPDEPSATQPAPKGSGTGGTAVAGTGDCGSVALAGAAIAATRVQGALPDSKGGALADGSYDLYEYRVVAAEGDPLPSGRKESLQIRDGGKRMDIVAEPASSSLSRGAFSLAIEGKTMKATQTCPAEAAGKFSGYAYSAEGSELSIILAGAVSYYRRRP